MHDPVSGAIATARKEELLLEIEHQCKLGDAGLLEEDKYLAKVNLEEMKSSSGERQHYWLLAIQTAQNAKYYGSNGSPNQQVVVTSQESRDEVRDASCIPPLVCLLQIFLSYCLGLPGTHKCVKKRVALSFVVLLQRCLAPCPRRKKTP